jgi:hypothetical protein
VYTHTTLYLLLLLLLFIIVVSGGWYMCVYTCGHPRFCNAPGRVFNKISRRYEQHAAAAVYNMVGGLYIIINVRDLFVWRLGRQRRSGIE